MQALSFNLHPTMSKSWFTSENFVIITSNIEIDSLQWQRHFRNNWNKIIRPNSKVLVLAGIHGCKDGNLGFVDNGLLKEYQRQVQFLKAKYKEDFERFNVEFIVENVGNYMDQTELDENKFIEAVKKSNPTVITLAFCYTSVSILHEILRASGIYTFLILSKDRADITDDKCVTLDATQISIIKRFIKNPFKNLFLWGSSGTGKTIILTEILKMKISHYKQKKIELNVFVTSYMAVSGSQLIKDFRERYLAYLPSECQIRIMSFNLLCQGKTECL